MGVSADEQRPMTRAEIERKGEEWQRRIYSEFKENRNLGSIVNIRGSDLEIAETDRYFYMMTYSFPCQDLSVAGKMAGMAKGGGTRSGLLWEVERLLRELKDSHSELPQCLFMENVPQVCGEQNRADFNRWTAFLQTGELFEVENGSVNPMWGGCTVEYAKQKQAEIKAGLKVA